MYLMNRFLQTDKYSFYGIGVLKDLLWGRPWSESGNFPRVTYCDLDIRQLGQPQRHTVQCVLVINIFTEKVFILLWLWYSLLAVISFTSFFSWVFSSLPFDQRKRFIARRLELADVEFKRKNFQKELEEFVRDYVKMDGVFVLKMLTIHSGILICTEIVDSMWDQFLRNKGAEVIDGLLKENGNGKVDQKPITERTASYPGHPFEFPNHRRKTSVLIPLLSVDEHDPKPPHSADVLLRPLSGIR
ncbi:hypothetical protein L596_007004 [Steinernema carpocapsae]|uniref:Innexin n=1 Tax=Steinernema carpocapsae TaxID=34508 RepID=A0A4U5P7U0_STECR|nr:hypothetical protein L596_007004 [Steinernema carpocapsae]